MSRRTVARSQQMGLRRVACARPALCLLGLGLAGCCLGNTTSDADERDATLRPYVSASTRLPDDPSHAIDARDVRFGEAIRLLGVAMPREAITPGGSARITFYWTVSARQIGGWSVFTHVLDERGERIVNADHAGPLRELVGDQQRLGPSSWKPGHVYTDTIAFDVPASARAPGTLRLAVGIYRGTERLPARGQGSDGEDRAIVAEIQLQKRAEPPVPELVVPRREGLPLVIDGRLDEPAWATAAITEAFVEPGSGAPAPTADPRGRARVLWDDSTLYLGFAVHSTRLEGGFAKDARDPHLWEHECVEVMIDPDGDGDNADYYELQISPQNLVFDSRFEGYNTPRGGPLGPFGHEDWTAGGQRAVVIDGSLDDDTDTDRGYTVELAVPFRSFDRARHVPPRPGDTWRVNFYVMKHNGGVAWSPILGQGNFHRASRFGRLRFGPPSPSSAASSSSVTPARPHP